MKLTKYEHACFTAEQDGQLLVVDPGGFTTDFIAPSGVIGIVVTHEHGDHFDHDQIASIIDKNPDAVVIGHPDVVSQIEAFETRAVNAGDTSDIGPFHLVFRGGQHALIHSSIPVIANLGVLINDLLYYPGDSFVLPGVSVDTLALALPAGAPWMKTGEAMDFLLAITPRLVFPTHDAFLSDAGKAQADRLLGDIARQNGIEYARLTDPIDL
jgi:L-ascorbate metabolism protein UlaG (beta-lactamase superfamily)